MSTGTAEETRRAGTFGRGGLIVDFAMIGLLVINVTLLVVEAIFTHSAVQQALRESCPRIFTLYNQHVHQNFLLIDGVFLAIFITEFCVRWSIAAHRRIYHRWFFYPLIHWYDLLGCIPVPSLRFLRGLRLVAIIYRLHRLGHIDIRRYYVYRVLEKYRAVVTEEISDRVVIHVLDGMQRDLVQGSPVVERIWREVVAPHKEQITEGVVARAETLLKEQVQDRRQHARAYVEGVIDRALEQCRHVFLDLERIPVLGKKVTRQVEQGIRVIVSQVVVELFDDLDRVDVKRVAGTVEQAVGEAFAARDDRIEETLRQAIYLSLQIIKNEVSVQQWKLRELNEKTTEGSAATS